MSDVAEFYETKVRPFLPDDTIEWCDLPQTEQAEILQLMDDWDDTRLARQRLETIDTARPVTLDELEGVRYE